MSSPSAPDAIPSRSLPQAESATLGNPTTSGSYVQDDQPLELLPYDGADDGVSPGKSDIHLGPTDHLNSYEATDLASGPAFESQVRSLLDRTKPFTPPSMGMYRNTSGHVRSVGQWMSVRGLVDDVDTTSIPSLEESQHLLDKFLYYLGVNQHFFDSRSFSDSIVLLFQTTETRQQQKQTTWYTEYLLVMAMAKLIDVEQPTSKPPGSALFTEALNRLPPLHNLGDEGVIAVEILTLVATYLQWCDRRHDAYLYVCRRLNFS